MRGNQVIEYPANQETLTERYTNEAVSFINKNKENPFFLYISHTFPHQPIFVGDNFKGSSGTSPYYDAIQEIDWSVGEVLKALKKNKLDKNTVVIFTSDNGPKLGSAKPLRGKKTETYEGGQRVPAIIWGPDEIKPGVETDELVSSLDLFPTIAKYAGISIPKDRIYDGYDISNFIKGKSKKTPRENMFYYSANSTKIDGVRSKDWKLLFNGDKRNRKDKQKASLVKPRLYNLKEDISESKDLANVRPEKVKELMEVMQEFDRDLEKDIVKKQKTSSLKE